MHKFDIHTKLCDYRKSWKAVFDGNDISPRNKMFVRQIGHKLLQKDLGIIRSAFDKVNICLRFYVFESKLKNNFIHFINAKKMSPYKINIYEV